MDVAIGLPALVVMLVGLAGTVVPVLPGLVIIWLAAVGSMVLAGWSTAAWVTAAILTVVLIGAEVTQYVLPARAGRAAGAPRSSLVMGGAFGIVGFFVIPVIGFVIGGVAGVYLAERRRLGDHEAAWSTTLSVLRSAGIAALIEVGAGIVMILVWAIHVLR